MLVEVSLTSNIMLDGYEPPAVEVTATLEGDYTLLKDPFGTGDHWHSIIEENWNTITVVDFDNIDVTNMVDVITMGILENDLVALAHNYVDDNSSRGGRSW